jgi:hypothetical protein
MFIPPPIRIKSVWKGEFHLVKGLSRRVIVVKPPDPMFDEAIFIVREDERVSSGVSGDEILLQAQLAVDNFIRENLGMPLRRNRFPYIVCAVAGAILASILWGLVMVALQL